MDMGVTALECCLFSSFSDAFLIYIYFDLWVALEGGRGMGALCCVVFFVFSLFSFLLFSLFSLQPIGFLARFHGLITNPSFPAFSFPISNLFLALSLSLILVID